METIRYSSGGLEARRERILPAATCDIVVNLGPAIPDRLVVYLQDLTGDESEETIISMRVWAESKEGPDLDDSHEHHYGAGDETEGVNFQMVTILDQKLNLLGVVRGNRMGFSTTAFHAKLALPLKTRTASLAERL